MSNNKKVIGLVIGSAVVGGLLGIVPPAYISANNTPEKLLSKYDGEQWKDVHFSAIVKDTLTLEERIQKIEEMMSVDMSIMTDTSNSTSRVSSSSSISYTAETSEVSESGKEFIKQYESLVLDAYKLRGEHRYTIGYGHVIYEKNFPHHITKKQADEIFEDDMKKYQSYVREMLNELDDRFRYSQGFVDGLTSLVYNCGPDGVRRTKFWKRMKACRYDKKTKSINKDDLMYAIEAVKTANISKIYKKGHQNRRKREHKTMITK